LCVFLKRFEGIRAALFGAVGVLDIRQPFITVAAAGIFNAG
jgi:hypothetical protein